MGPPIPFCRSMIQRALVLLIMVSPICALRAEQVVVTGVAGQVLFWTIAPPGRVVKAGERFGAGTFSAASNGILYLSTFEGSELRLGESGTLRYDAIEDKCLVEHPPGARSTFKLLQGKLEVNIKVPSRPIHCYRITLAHAQASVGQGQCVLCMHGGGTFVYVARGQTMISGEDTPDLVPGVDVAPSFRRVTSCQRKPKDRPRPTWGRPQPNRGQ